MGSPLFIRIALVGGVALALTACGPNPPARPSDAALARLKPADARLAGLYRQSCKACHAVPASGAPLAHDHAAWDPRWSKGLPVLVDHAITGFQAMPAGGQCATCTKADYEGLIRFMADQEKSK